MSRPISMRKALKEWTLYLFILPSLAAIGLFSYYPALSAIYHSLFEWSGGETEKLVGFANYRRAFHDTVLWTAFETVAILVVANVFKLIPSIAMAVAVHRLKSERWQYGYRVLLVAPMIVPGLVTLFIWKFFFDPNLGVINRILDGTGLKHLLVWVDHLFHWNVFHQGIPIAWLSQPQLIIPSLVIWGFPWIGAVGVLIFLAGLQSIGAEVYEAAELDGAGSAQKFFHVELPMITTQVRVMLILLVIGTLKDFGLQYLLLGPAGGAGGRGMVPGLWMFNRAFVQGEFGYACAIGMILFAFILVLTWLNNKLVRVDK